MPPNYGGYFFVENISKRILPQLFIEWKLQLKIFAAHPLYFFGLIVEGNFFV